MELYSYINPLGANSTKWWNTYKISFIFTVPENLYLQNFRKLVIRKNKYSQKTIFLLVKITALGN